MEKELVRKKSSSKLEDPNTGENGNQSPKFDQDNFNAVIEELKDHSQLGLIGGQGTLSAFKNRTSYAIGTDSKGLEVIEDSLEVYSARLPDTQKLLRDLIYIEHLDCYILNLNLKIYRKDIGGKPPYLYMNLNCGSTFSKCFRYSKVRRRLFVSNYHKNIAVVNLDRKEVEILVKIGKGTGYIRDFSVFGNKVNKLALITSGSLIHFYTLCSRLKKVITKYSHQIPRIQDRNEEPTCLGVDDQGNHLLAGLRNLSVYSHSRMIIYRLSNQLLVPLHVLDENDQKTDPKYLLASVRRVGRSLLWVALSSCQVLFYAFSSESGELRELVEKKVNHEGGCKRTIHLIDDNFFWLDRMERYFG